MSRQFNDCFESPPSIAFQSDLGHCLYRDQLWLSLNTNFAGISMTEALIWRAQSWLSVGGWSTSIVSRWDLDNIRWWCLQLTCFAPGPRPSLLWPDQQAGASRQQCDWSMADQVLTSPWHGGWYWPITDTGDDHQSDDGFINLWLRGQSTLTLVIYQESHFSHAHTS